MKQIQIIGNKTLKGKIRIGGAKNSAVALMPAALLADGKCIINNVPNITDRDALFDIIKLLNVDISKVGTTVTVDTSKIENKFIPDELSTKLRASYYFMGVLLARYKHVEISFPGGCNIGTRPIDLHLKGFKALGATVTSDNKTHKYIIDAKELKGSRIHLNFASVGATINIMYAATLAKGVTVIENAAKETEIINIADFLNKMGAKITGAGTSKITIEGVEKLVGTNIDVIPDRIEAGTYLIIGAALSESLTVCGIKSEYVQSLLNKLKDMGVNYDIDGDEITVHKAEQLNPINITTLVYPGFPTDLGQPMSVLLTQANGTSYFEETIWENRLQHIPYLRKMGANIKEIDTMHAEIKGPTKLHGEDINATDLRGGAALVIAGLIAEGKTLITDIDYILRGYEHLINKLQSVGADIRIIDSND